MGEMIVKIHFAVYTSHDDLEVVGSIGLFLLFTGIVALGCSDNSKVDRRM